MSEEMGIDLDKTKAYHLVKKDEYHDKAEALKPAASLAKKDEPCDVSYRCVYYKKLGYINNALEHANRLAENLTGEVKTMKEERHEWRGYVEKLLMGQMSEELMVKVRTNLTNDIKLEMQNNKIDGLEGELRRIGTEHREEIQRWVAYLEVISDLEHNEARQLKKEREARAMTFASLPKIRVGT